MSGMDGIHRLLGPLRRRIATMVSRCILSVVNPNAGIQQVQVSILADEVMDGVEHMEPYGYTSHPLAGGEGVLLNVAGQRGAAVAVNIGGRAFRLQGLAAGEVALYTDEKDTLIFKRGNIVELTTKHFIVNAEADMIVNTKNFQVNAGAAAVIEAPEFVLGGPGGSSASAAMQADIDQDGKHTSTGDQVAGSVSQIHHPHENVHPGSGQSGKPVGGA